MPKFDKRPGGGKDDGGGGKKDLLTVPESWTEPRCHVCNSKYRRAIDRMIAYGANFSEISRVFGGEIDRRSISSHAKKHLNYEEAAVRRIIEQEADRAQEDAEEGIQGALNRRIFLQVFVQRSFEALLNGDLELTGKDAMNAITMMDKLDGETEGAALDELRLQFNAFVQSIREVCPPDQWQKILDRTKELLDLSPVAEIAPQNE